MPKASAAVTTALIFTSVTIPPPSPRHRPHHYRPHHEEISLRIGIGLARSLAFDENTGI